MWLVVMVVAAAPRAGDVHAGAMPTTPPRLDAAPPTEMASRLLLSRRLKLILEYHQVVPA